MRWPWKRHRPDPQPSWQPPAPIPDHDRVFPQWRLGEPIWSPLLGEWINEPTQPLPIIDQPPLLTPAQQWRGRGGRS